MELGLENARVIVASATRGLGFAAAEAFIAEGARVAICGRNAEDVDAAVQRLGAQCIGIQADVSTPNGATEFVAAARSQLGGVSVLVPNAGGPPAGRPGEVSLEDYESAFRLNCMSTIAMCEAALPTMRTAQHGRIVAITSVSVRQPIANLVLSTTARSAATAYLSTLARQVASEGITVNSVQPGFHLTDRLAQVGDLEAIRHSIPAGRIGDPASFGKVIAFLASDAANFITGAHLQVDGGTYAGVL